MTGEHGIGTAGDERRAMLIGSALVLAILVVALIGANGILLIALLAAAPLYASSQARPEQTIVVSAFAVLAATIMGAAEDGLTGSEHAAALIAVLLGAALAYVRARDRDIVAEEHDVDLEETATRTRAHVRTETRRLTESTLEPDELLAEIASVTVPSLADICVVDLLRPDGVLVETAVVAADQAVADGLRERPRYGPEPDVEHPLMDAVRTGEPTVMPAVTDEILYALAGSPERFDLLVGVGVTSALAQPMVSRGRTVGVLWMLRAGGRPPFDEVEVLVVGDVAGRTALAFENARLSAALEAPR